MKIAIIGLIIAGMVALYFFVGRKGVATILEEPETTPDMDRLIDRAGTAEAMKASMLAQLATWGQQANKSPTKTQEDAQRLIDHLAQFETPESLQNEIDKVHAKVEAEEGMTYAETFVYEATMPPLTKQQEEEAAIMAQYGFV